MSAKHCEGCGKLVFGFEEFWIGENIYCCKDCAKRAEPEAFEVCDE